MKQLYKKTGYRVGDLTEGRIHRIEEDGKVKYFACFPKKWDAGDLPKMTAMDGRKYQFYDVIEWEEVEIEVKGS